MMKVELHVNMNATQPSCWFEDGQRLLGDVLSVPRHFASVPPNLCCCSHAA